MDLEIKQKLTSNWFKSLQEMFCKTISDFEKNKISFKSTSWKRNLKKDEGGGEYRILKDGKIFDKVGVNFSKVYGKFPKKFQQNIPGAQKDPRFWASGISVVMHMKNPLIPAMHFNTRYICTTFDWFGGGIDVTPSKKDNKELSQDKSPKKAVKSSYSKKKKTKKNILNGIAYVQSTFNNTIISIADTNGNVISWASAGQKGFKGSRKSTPYAAQIAADAAASKALEFGMKTLSVEVKGPGSGRETALRALQARGFRILSIKDTTPMPHNGTRPPKKRRV